jgi:PAS domain S-box-containing protein
MTSNPKPLILNVDDTETSRLATTLILRKAGFDVVEASTGRDGLNLAEKRPNLVLLDVNLPDISGFEVCRQLKQNPRTSAIPVLHLSASYVTSDDRVTGLDEGADGYLTQPVEPRELVATIKAFLRLKHAEQALGESERWHRALFEHAHDALLTLAPPTWRFTSGNPAALKMLGIHNEGDLVLCSILECSPERQPDGRASAEKVQELLEAAMRSGSKLFEWILERASGERFPASVLLTRIEGDDRPLLLVTLRDESEKKRLEASMAQADRLANMGMLATSMAHELNNPLAYVHYNVESLAQDLPLLASAAERCRAALLDRVGEVAYADIVGDGASMLAQSMLEDTIDRAREALNGTQRMKAMTRGLGIFSRVEQVERSRFKLETAIEAAISLAANELTQRARLVKTYGQVPAIWASEGKLSQVFLNLLRNAAHAIEEGDAQNNQIRIRTWAEPPDALAEVTDTGKGIPPENLKRIFEPFFTTKPAGLGTGLGLAICSSIVTEFGGDLRVESEVGKGTRFVLRLPIKPELPEERRAAIVSEIPRDRSKTRGRLLIVDDEEAIRKSMERMLGQDHDPIAVGSGEQARELLERDPAFDVVLCDLMMSGMSGMALHAWLTERDPWLAKQVVFVTGGAFTPRASEYLVSVGNLVLEKPVDAVELKRVVSKLVRAARGAK